MSRATEKSVVSEKSAVTQKTAERRSPTIEPARLRYTGALSALSPAERTSLVRRTSARGRRSTVMDHANTRK